MTQNPKKLHSDRCAIGAYWELNNLDLKFSKSDSSLKYVFYLLQVLSQPYLGLAPDLYLLTEIDASIRAKVHLNKASRN